MWLWIERYNAMGIDGLIYRPRPGRPRLLEDDVMRGNNPADGGQRVAGWTTSLDRGETHRLAAQEKGFELSCRTLAGYLTNDGEALTDKPLQSLQGVLGDTKLVRCVCSLPSLNRK